MKAFEKQLRPARRDGGTGEERDVWSVTSGVWLTCWPPCMSIKMLYSAARLSEKISQTRTICAAVCHPVFYTSSGETCIFTEVAPCLWKTGYPRPGTPTLPSSPWLSCQACWLLSCPRALSSSWERSAAGSAGSSKTLQGSTTRPIWPWSDVGQGPVCCLLFSAPIVKGQRRRNVRALPRSIFCADLVYWVRLFVTAGHALRCAVRAWQQLWWSSTQKARKAVCPPADVTMNEQSAAQWQTPTVSPSTWFPCSIDMHEVMRSRDPAQWSCSSLQVVSFRNTLL